MSAVVCTKCGALTVAQCQCVQWVGIAPGNIYEQQHPENIIATLTEENARLRLALTDARAQMKRDVLALLDYKYSSSELSIVQGQAIRRERKRLRAAIEAL